MASSAGNKRSLLSAFSLFPCRATSCFSMPSTSASVSRPSLVSPVRCLSREQPVAASPSHVCSGTSGSSLCLVLHKFSAAVLRADLAVISGDAACASLLMITSLIPLPPSHQRVLLSSLLSLIQVSELFTHSPSLLVIISLCRHFHDCFSRRRRPLSPSPSTSPSNTSRRTIRSKNNCRSPLNSLLLCCFSPFFHNSI